ncbi:MAG: sorting protein, partial [Verrucomicrobiaceae bacterium]|nr:sorting protein [Verrucomicrobiaceae bacterium]
SNLVSGNSGLILGGVTPNFVNGVGGAAPLGTFPGATLNVTSKPSTNNSQTFAGLTLNPSQSTISTTQGASGNVLLNLGAITRNPGALASFSQAGTVGATNAITTTTGNDGATGILGGWAVTNIAGAVNYATVSAGNIVPYAAYTAATTSIVDGANTNVNLTGSTSTAAAGATINTLRVGQAGTGTTALTLAGTLRLGVNGGILLPTGNQALTITGGTLTAGGSVANAPGEISIIGTTSSVTASGNPSQIVINSAIANNGTGPVTLTVGEYAGAIAASTEVLDLEGNNTYSGGTFINGGRVRAGTSTAFGTGQVTVLNGAQAFLLGSTYTNAFNIAGSGTTFATDSPSALRLNGGQTLSGAINLLADAIISNGSSTGNTLSGKISGTGGLTLLGSGGTGTITLSNTTNNFTGGVRIDTDRLMLGASEVIPHGPGAGNVVLVSNTTSSVLDLNGFDETINGLSNEGSLGSFVQNGGNGTNTLTLGAGDATATTSTVIRNNSGVGTGVVALSKIGAGTQTVTSVNTFSGGLNIKGGTLISDVNGNALGGGFITLGDTSGSANAALQMNNTGRTLTNPIIVAAGSTGTRSIQTFGNGQTFNFNGPVTLNSNLNLNTFAGQTNTINVSGAIAGAGGLNVNAAGGAVTLSGANNYSGATNITAGSLVAGSTGSLSSNSAFSLTNTANTVLNLNGFNSSIGSLSGGGTVGGNVVLGGATLTLGGNNTSTTFAGVISGGGLTKIGSGIQTLSGANLFTGPTSINGGTLRISGSLANTPVTVGALGTLSGTGTLGGLVTLTGAGSAINLQDNSIGTLTFGAGLTLNDGNVLSFDIGAPSISDRLNLSGGAFTYGGTGAATINLANLGGMTAGTYNLITGASGIDLNAFTLSNPAFGGFSLELGVTGGNTLTLSVALGAVYWTGNVNNVWNTNNAGVTNFGNVDGTMDASLVPTTAVPVIFSASNVTTDIATTLGADVGVKTLTFRSPTAVAIGGGNKLTIGTASVGGLTVEAGAGAVTITANQIALGTTQTWTNSSSNPLTVTSAISGSGGLTVTGGGTFTFSGNSTFSGGLTLGAGSTLNINSGGNSTTNSAIGSGTFTINGGATIDNTSASPVTILSNNAQNWNGDFTFTGTKDLNLGTGAVALGGNRIIKVGGSTLTVGGVISGVGRSLTKIGSGTLVLGGANTFTGGMSISEGTVQINNPAGLGTGAATLANAAILALNIGANTFSTAINGSGTINVTPNGETRLRGSLAGFTGTLNIGANGAAKTDIDSSTTLINSGATINIANGGTLLVANNAGTADVGASINVSGSGNTENLGALRVENGGLISGIVTMTGDTSIGSQTGTGTISGIIGETGGSRRLTKVGGGTLVLAGANTFSGNTTVSAGVLVLANSLALQNSSLVSGTVSFTSSVA